MRLPLPIISHINISIFASLWISPSRNITTDARACTHTHTHTQFVFTDVKGKIQHLQPSESINVLTEHADYQQETQLLETHEKHVTQFQVSDLENDNIILITPVPTFGSSRCGLTDRFLISSCVYFLSARDQIDQRETKKANEVTNNAELARSKQLDDTQLTSIPYTQCCFALLFYVSKILAMHL